MNGCELSAAGIAWFRLKLGRNPIGLGRERHANA